MIDKEIEKAKVTSYLAERLAPLTIEKDNGKPTSVIELAKSESLIGFCWESTQTCSLFFNDDDYIERGIVMLGEDPFYNHSWICFKLDGKEYVFDPALNQIATKERFYERFKIDEGRICSRISVKDIRSYFLRYLKDPTMRESQTQYQRSRYVDFDESLIKQFEEGNIIVGTGNMDDPFFAGVVSYKPTFEGDKIKKLEAHIHNFIISK